MEQVLEFFTRLLDTSDWPPRWFCGTWSSFHGWLYIISDLLIWLAYAAIPVLLLWFVRRQTTMPFAPVFLLFAGFIVLCGATHLMDALIFWWPAYRLSALLRLFAALVSIGTVLVLVRMIPTALQLKSLKAYKAVQSHVESLEDELADSNAVRADLMEVLQLREERIITLQQEIQRLRGHGEGY